MESDKRKDRTCWKPSPASWKLSLDRLCGPHPINKLNLSLTQRIVDWLIADVWHCQENQWNSCQLHSTCCCRIAMAMRGWTNEAGSREPRSWAHCSRCRARKKSPPWRAPHLRTDKETVRHQKIPPFPDTISESFTDEQTHIGTALRALQRLWNV